MRCWFCVIHVGLVFSDPVAPTSSVNVEIANKEETGAMLRTVNAHGDIETFDADTVLRSSKVQVPQNIVKMHAPSSGKIDKVRQQRHREGFALEPDMKSSNEHKETAHSDLLEPLEDSLEKHFPSMASLLRLWGKALLGGFSSNDSVEEPLDALDGHDGKLLKNAEEEEWNRYEKQKQEQREVYKEEQEEQGDDNKKQQKEQQKIYRRAARAAHKTQQEYRKNLKHPLKGAKGHNFYAPADRDMWINFGAAALTAFCIDVFAVRKVALRMEERIGIPAWTAHLAFSMVAAFAFSSYMFLERGETACMSWLNGFLMEVLLSVDNLLVFSMIFTSWKTPAEARYKPLVWGISGAILIRLALFSAFQFFINVHFTFVVLLAAFLIYTGTMTILEEDDDEEVDYQNSLIITCISKVCPTIPRYEKDSFVFDGKLTLLFFVMVCIEVTDVVFAFDSISAKVAQLPDGYTAYTSTVFAMFTLRSLFWILDSFIRTFAYVKYGIAGLMYYIALKMVFPQYLDVSDGIFFVLISLVFAVCVIMTYVYPPAEKKMDEHSLDSRQFQSESTAASSTDRVIAPEDNVDLKKPSIIHMSD